MLVDNIDMYCMWITTMDACLRNALAHTHERFIHEVIALSGVHETCLLSQVPQIVVLWSYVLECQALFVCQVGKHALFVKSMVNITCKQFLLVLSKDTLQTALAV